MPIVITQDDEQRRVIVTVTDPWSVEEIAVATDRQMSGHAWRYGTLYDMRTSEWVPSEPDVLWLVKRGQQQVAVHGARGPVAVLIDGTTHAAAFQQYAEYAGEHSHMLVKVFVEQAAALAWLAQFSL